MATCEQYLRLVINFATIAAISRLLTPTEVGVSVIGTGIMTILLGVREFATSEFLIQRKEIGPYDVRASFTLLFLLTTAMMVAVFTAAPWAGSFYGEEMLAAFLKVSAVAGLIEAISLPIRGLLRRDMEFGTLALINVASAAMTALASIALAFAGFSYMSVAWGVFAAAITTTVLSIWFRPDWSMFRPHFGAWGRVLAFGGYNGASYVINRIYVAFPQLVLGHVLPPSAVGLYNRACVVSDIPDKIVLTSVFSVAFPAFAAEARRNGNLKHAYLRSLSLITVFYWPALVLLIILAYPVVTILLGQQWFSVIPPLQLLAVSALAWFPVVLTSPVLLAVGANRDRVMADLIGRSVAAPILCLSAFFGIMAMAASKLITIPFQTYVSFQYTRRHIPFAWRELGAALWKSAVITAGSAIGPLGVALLSPSGFDLSFAATALAVLLAVIGWLLGALATRHAVLTELLTALAAAMKTRFVHDLASRAPFIERGAGEAR